jgi:hypothetical protein
MKQERSFFRALTVLLCGALFLVGAIIYAYPGYAMTKAETPIQKIDTPVSHAFKFWEVNLHITSEQGLDNAVAGTDSSIQVKGLYPPFTVKSSNQLLSITQTRTDDAPAEGRNPRDANTWPGAVFQVKFLAAGQSQLIVEDSKGNRATIQITVKGNNTLKF